MYNGLQEERIKKILKDYIGESHLLQMWLTLVNECLPKLYCVRSTKSLCKLFKILNSNGFVVVRERLLISSNGRKHFEIFYSLKGDHSSVVPKHLNNKSSYL